MMKETPPTLTLEATTFNKPQLQEQLSVLEQRQEAQIAHGKLFLKLRLVERCV